MSFGFGFGFTKITAAIRAAFSPSSLFAANESGVWYDPSDLSTLYQDAAGTTPVTAVEQPVGLMLDKSKGVVLGPELVTNGDFSNGTTGWTKSGTGTIQVVNGRLRITGGDTSSFTDATQSFQTVAGKTYRLNISGYPGTAGRAYTITPVVAFFNEGYSCFFTAAATTTTILLRAATGSGGYTTGYAEFDNISVRELPGNHAYQTTATSRPVLRQDGSGKHYLYFDGVDDWLVTNTITPGTDKVQVFAGVRKLSSAASAIAELSSNYVNNGAFGVFCEGSPGAINNYEFGSKGTILQQVIASPFAAPITNALTAIGDISGDLATLRVNGSQVAQSTANQGSGNYGNYPLYIGRRGGTSLPFNGHLYSLIVRFGSNLPAATIEQTEKYINTKTRAY